MNDLEVIAELEALIARIEDSGSGYADCNKRLVERLSIALDEYHDRFSDDSGPAIADGD